MCLAAVVGSLAAERDVRIADAARRKDAAAVGALVKQRADVNGALADGATALHWAVYWDDAPTVELLVKAGANANAVNELGVTAVVAGVHQSQRGMVQRLLAAHADPNQALPTGETPLMTCARSGNVAAVKALVSRGAQVNARDHERVADRADVGGRAHHADVVRLLVEVGADVMPVRRSAPSCNTSADAT